MLRLQQNELFGSFRGKQHQIDTSGVGSHADVPDHQCVWKTESAGVGDYRFFDLTFAVHGSVRWIPNSLLRILADARCALIPGRAQ